MSRIEIAEMNRALTAIKEVVDLSDDADIEVENEKVIVRFTRGDVKAMFEVSVYSPFAIRTTERKGRQIEA